MTPEVIVYSTEFCAYCQSAKQLLTKLRIPYEERHLDNDPDLRQRLSAENQGYRTVPMIFVEGKFIGGFNELMQMNRAGKLSHLVVTSG